MDIKKKKKIAKLFTKELLSIDPENVFNVTLFGGVAYGKATKDSDIDIMIFAKHPKELLEKIEEISFNFLLNKNELIEPQIYSVKDYKNPSSYFVWQVVNKGKKLYEYDPKRKIKTY